MNRYTVNATLSVPAWLEVHAESEEDAVAHAMGCAPGDFYYDLSEASVAFNVVSPIVERES